MAAHAHPVAENRPAAEGAGRVDREHRDAAPAAALLRDQHVDEGGLAGPRGAGDADHVRAPGRREDGAQDLAAARVAIIQPADGAGAGGHLAGQQFRGDVHHVEEDRDAPRSPHQARRYATMSRVSVPMVKTLAKPAACSSGRSSSGITPPATKSLSAAPCDCSSCARRGRLRVCPAERLETPTTSTSSWIAAFATASGVCLRPVKITSIPASRSACATTVIPTVCVSMPSLARRTRSGRAGTVDMALTPP